MANSQLPYLLVDAFTDTPGGGNRVALVLDARGMSSGEMHRIAQRLAYPQAAFVTDWLGGSYSVRFFTPSGEVEFAGHAAIALALTLARQGMLAQGETRLFLRTPMETLPVELEYEAGTPIKAVLRGPSPRFRDPPQWKDIREVMEVLGVGDRYLHRGLPYGVAFTGLWSLFLPFVAPGLVDEVEPEMERLGELCARLEVATLHAYAPLGPRTFYARDFAPLLGIPEDPVTGSANAALGALLARAGVVPRREEAVDLTVLQGHRLGMPGTVEVRVEFSPGGEPYRVFIGGKAVQVESGRLEL
ncbi:MULTISPECIES: PhzF family phenazine biosynthesis protein [unclassified Meiothermus]|uniref:PhzF family phenazine biosynthesis protein n=1 Tax=unclassified Meiothermus TaxID=370471 RepID=UPI000D7C8EFA|nr:MULTISPECIES: PhzF family phenazine biosynthesis protein [unclassified Meiothermus]PZA06916.1 PhzF family phenazine biosynthesis protein [Meiothermus sp. Pnk-1]RYM38311.1 PhzF family phenazine biosynthesis protein [Meiothermus sp. PNK-Is4]